MSPGASASPLPDLSFAAARTARPAPQLPGEPLRRLDVYIDLARLRTGQPTYSILARGIERDILPVCDRYGMGVLTWSPLAWGLLTGKYRPGHSADVSSSRAQWGPRHMSDQNKFAAVERLATVADEAGISMTHLAMASVTADLSHHRPPYPRTA